MDEQMVKITVAAEALDVSYKTLYNWIEDGTLELAHPGFVYLSEARRAKIKKINMKSEWSKEQSSRFFRENGKFKLLSGEHNGKSYSGLRE